MLRFRCKSVWFARVARGGLMLACFLLPAGAIRYWLAAPTTPDRYYAQGLAAFRDQRLEELQACADALEAFPGYEPHSRLLAGMVHLRRGDLQTALDHFWHARHHEQTRPRAFSLTGEAFYRQGNHREALRILSVALQADPENVEAHRWIAAVSYDLGAMDRALQHLARVSELDPEDPRPSRLSGLIHMDFERYELAIAAYREALRRHPAPDVWDEVRVELAQCLRKTGEFEEALAVLEPAAALPDADAVRAESHLALGNTQRAGEIVQRALEQAPEHRDALLVQANLAVRTGDAEQAAEVLEQVAAGHPRDDLVRYRLAQVYRRLGRHEDAQREAELMRELRELGKQFTLLHERAFNDLTDADLRYQLGQLADRLGRPVLALTWYEAALALEPQHRPAREAWQKMQQQRTAGIAEETPTSTEGDS